MLMNSHYDGYVFGQATSPNARKSLQVAARRGNRAARAVVQAQSQLGAFGDDPWTGESVVDATHADTDYTGTSPGDPNGWPPSAGVDPDSTITPPPAPPAGTGVTLKDVKGVGADVITTAGDALAMAQKVKTIVAPLAAGASSPAAAQASTIAGNAGAACPSCIANAILAFRNAIAAFCSGPSAATVNAALNAYQGALMAYSDDKGNPSQNTANIIAQLNYTLTVCIQQYDATYDGYKATHPAGNASGFPVYVPATATAARMASLTLDPAAPSAKAASDAIARAGLANVTAPGTSSGSLGIIALGIGAFLFLR